MTDYQDLNDSFDAQLDKTAQFVPTAFHVHSIDSHDWGKGGNDEADDREHFRGDGGPNAFLDALIDAGLEIVCVVDHMKCGYACELAALAVERGDITILPGMEVNVMAPPNQNERIHVLTIFPPSHDPEVIGRIFQNQPNIPAEANRTGHEDVVVSDLAEWRKVVEDQGGLFVVAHIDQEPRGHRAHIRKALGQTAAMFGSDLDELEVTREISDQYVEYLAALNPNAVEVLKSADRPHYVDVPLRGGDELRMPCVATSDHHNIASFKDKSAITYLKVSRRDFECVSDALQFDDTRIRFSDDLPESPSPRLVGLRIRSTESGLFGEAEIAFNENLNCLIGPRGCGKSTVVEALRYVLCQTSLLKEATDLDEGEASYAKLARATQLANLKDTEIELIYESNRERHLLTATFDENNDFATRAFNLDGSGRELGADSIASTYPVRIFSWSELETLGREPSLQRIVIDRLVPGLRTLEEERSEGREKLRANRVAVAEKIGMLDRILSSEDGALRRYAASRTAFERLNTQAVAALFADLDALRAKTRLLGEIDESLEALEADLAEIDPTGLQLDAESSAGEDDGTKSWWEEELSAELSLSDLEQEIGDKLGEIGTALTERRTKITARIEALATTEGEKEASIRVQTQATSDEAVRRDQRESAREAFEQATRIRNSYLAAMAEATSLLDDRGDIIQELALVSEQIYDARAALGVNLGEKLADVGEGGPRIEIQIHKDGDRAALERHLDQEFLNSQRAGGRYHQNGIAAKLAARTPATIAWSIASDDPAPLLTGEGLAGGLSPAEALQLTSSITLIEFEESAEVQVLDAALVDEVLLLQECETDDLIQITADGTPVDTLSPGGRSSAMLPLIALSDVVPLIIDQPEDNLDNRMVGRTLSTILADLKEKRQIIVTTHNPNIVVGGDAEQVVVLGAADARSAVVEETGCIDDPDIIQSVIEIMEGGKEAFLDRGRRYQKKL